MAQGLRAYRDSPPGCAGDHTVVIVAERPIRMARSREAQLRCIDGSRRKLHPTWPEKAPERSGSADANHALREQSAGRSYGDPVLERWRPGGAVLAITGQGSQAYLSLPPSCVGVSYSKA